MTTFLLVIFGFVAFVAITVACVMVALLYFDHGLNRSLNSMAARVFRERKARERAAVDSIVGREGAAVTDLRPGGLVQIDGSRHDALAEGAAIDAGERVRVVSVESGRVKVRRAR